MKTIIFSLYTLLCFVTIIAFTFIEARFFPESETPSLFVLAGTGIMLSVLTAGMVKMVIEKTFLKHGKIIHFMSVFLILIILAKFIFAPASMYEANKIRENQYLDYFTNESSGPLLTAISTFLLYVLVIILVKNYFVDKYVLKKHDPLMKKKIALLSLFSISLFSIINIIVPSAILIVIVFLQFFWLTGATIEYALLVFSSPLSWIILMVLLLALFSLILSYNEVVQTKNIPKNLAIIGSFTSILIAFMFTFHSLWIVFMLILLSNWPLKVVTAK